MSRSGTFPAALLAVMCATTMAVSACSSSAGSSSASPSTAPGGTSGGASAASTASATDHSASGTKQACDLVSTDQIATAFGGTVAAGVNPQDVPNENRCRWPVTGTTNLGATGTVVVFYTSNQSRSAYDTGKAGLSANVAGVSGVGDDAYYFTSLGALTFVKGDTVITVQGTFRGAPADALKTDVTALAKVVVANA